MDVREKTASEKRLIDYYYLEEKIECPGVRLVYWDDIESAPIVDAVEVIRCRECKYRSKAGCPIIDANIWMDDEDFFSHGERRIDDAD